jgi:hypothetical protein
MPFDGFSPGKLVLDRDVDGRLFVCLGKTGIPIRYLKGGLESLFSSCHLYRIACFDGGGNHLLYHQHHSLQLKLCNPLHRKINNGKAEGQTATSQEGFVAVYIKCKFSRKNNWTIFPGNTEASHRKHYRSQGHQCG